MKFTMYLTGAGYIEIDPMWTYIPDETFNKFIELTDGTEVIDGRSVSGPLPGNTFIPFTDAFGNILTDTPEATCTHEMKEYVGLTARYNYCTKCDHKE